MLIYEPVYNWTVPYCGKDNVSAHLSLDARLMPECYINHWWQLTLSCHQVELSLDKVAGLQKQQRWTGNGRLWRSTDVSDTVQGSCQCLQIRTAVDFKCYRVFGTKLCVQQRKFTTCFTSFLTQQHLTACETVKKSCASGSATIITFTRNIQHQSLLLLSSWYLSTSMSCSNACMTSPNNAIYKLWSGNRCCAYLVRPSQAFCWPPLTRRRFVKYILKLRLQNDFRSSAPQVISSSLDAECYGGPMNWNFLLEKEILVK